MTVPAYLKDCLSPITSTWLIRSSRVGMLQFLLCFIVISLTVVSHQKPLKVGQNTSLINYNYMNQTSPLDYEITFCNSRNTVESIWKSNCIIKVLFLLKMQEICVKRWRLNSTPTHTSEMKILKRLKWNLTLYELELVRNSTLKLIQLLIRKQKTASP